MSERLHDVESRLQKYTVHENGLSVLKANMTLSDAERLPFGTSHKRKPVLPQIPVLHKKARQKKGAIVLGLGNIIYTCMTQSLQYLRVYLVL